MTTPQSELKVLDNTLILANAAAVSARVVRKIVGGDELSSNIAGQTASVEVLQQMASRDIAQALRAQARSLPA